MVGVRLGKGHGERVKVRLSKDGIAVDERWRESREAGTSGRMGGSFTVASFAHDTHTYFVLLPPIDFRLLAAAFPAEAFVGAAFLAAALPAGRLLAAGAFALTAFAGALPFPFAAALPFPLVAGPFAFSTFSTSSRRFRRRRCIRFVLFLEEA